MNIFSDYITRHIRFYFTILILFLLLCISCQSGKNQEEKQIAVTILPQQFFAERIAGDKYKVICMVPSGSSPESYEPAPSQLMALSRCNAYFKIGYIGFEMTWMDKLKKTNPQMEIFNTADRINLIHGHACNHDHHGHDHGHSHPHKHDTGIDPHTWSSPKAAAIIVKNMQQAFIKLDPENELFYTANTNILLEEIHQADSLLENILQTTRHKTFLIYHPTLTYFARDYGLNQIAIEQEGKEPSPTQLKELIRQVKEQDIKLIFVQKEFDERNAQAIARETDCKLVTINPLDYDWITETKNISQAFKDE
ncbi:MAG: zinc ABC transporter substrate-binding protein [Candidatus Azobacteroides sp.]|nr:zinc ABC transporter substrate-binding protein [Candidatus Azobacteroides sp.]